MSKGPSSAARAIAVIGIVCGFIALIVVVSASFDDDDGKGGQGGALTRQTGGKDGKAAYVVQSGDTLTSIARRTGVPVRRIEALNPGVDPQILVSGEKLKLR